MFPHRKKRLKILKCNDTIPTASKRLSRKEHRQRLANRVSPSTLKRKNRPTEVEMNEEPVSLFGLLILSLGNAALMGIGLVPDPNTNSTSVNLELARHNIELLAMLQEKTKGNLENDEHRLLEELLFDLRMRFVDAKRGVC
jgi:hypothetical protein